MSSFARGRPRTSSRGVLEEAAIELFLEQGYESTTIDHIAQRAGVSRATFFNYFSSKADVLWCAVDDEIHALDADLQSGRTLAEALRNSSDRLQQALPPFIASQVGTISAEKDFAAEAGKRIVTVATTVAKAGIEADRVWIVTGALLHAALSWARGGPQRLSLSNYLGLYTSSAPELVA